MNPRLESVPLTTEDMHIWNLRWADRYRFEDRLLYYSYYIDRRDAESMFWRESFRQQCANLRAPQMRPTLWLLCMGNPTSAPKTL